MVNTTVLVIGVNLNSKRHYTCLKEMRYNDEDKEEYLKYSWFISYINSKLQINPNSVRFTPDKSKALGIAQRINSKVTANYAVTEINYFEEQGFSISNNKIRLNLDQKKIIEEYEKMKTKISIKRIIKVIPTRYNPRKKFGDFRAHLNDDNLRKNGICLFNDDLENWVQAGINPNKKLRGGGGNACARPFQHLGHSIGIPTGIYRLGGFKSLDDQFSRIHRDDESLYTVKEILQMSYERIIKHIIKYPEKDTIYYSVNPTDEVGSTKIGVGIFSKTIGDDVVDEISRLIQMIPEGVRKAEEEK